MPRPPPRPFAEQEGHGARNRGERITIVANPRAGGGRAGASKDAIEAAVRRAFENADVRWTERPGHATQLAREAAEDSNIVAALGGDGTCSEVVDGLVRDGRAVRNGVIFAVLPYGTGGDLVRSLEVPRGLRDALWVASTGVTVPLDVAEARWPDGAKRSFLNVLGAGVNAEVCHIANASSKRLGGRVTFVTSILTALRRYQPRHAAWSWTGPDGDGSMEMETLAAFCANGAYCGAGLWVGRGGSMNDALLDLTVLPPIAAATALFRLPAAYRGELDSIPGARRVRASEVRIHTDLPIEIDGEPRSAGPLSVRVVPRALMVRGGWLHPPGSVGIPRSPMAD